MRIMGLGTSMMGTQMMAIVRHVNWNFYSLVPSPHMGGSQGVNGARAMLIIRVMMEGAVDGSVTFNHLNMIRKSISPNVHIKKII
jgi:hypothetical protein